MISQGVKKEKSILFNTVMVKAILDGQKTQTRRISTDVAGLVYKNTFSVPSSRYQVGDILYVREAFGEYYEMCNHGNFCDCEPKIIYKAGNNFPYDKSLIKKWKPSIHMAKEYARIFLHVKSIRVERLQDISIDDCRAEGWNKVYLGKPHISTWDTNNGKEVRNVLSCFDWYKDIWNSVAPTVYKWEDNPYVFVYEFERILV